MEGIVIFNDFSLKNAFEILKDTDKELHSQIDKATSDIRENVFCGRNVKKKLIPKKFSRKYGIDNLWIYNLRSGWRLLYSVSSPDKIKILAIVLNWMNHKEYEKLFKF
ncbi:hypothetical protein KAI04_00575 [Candidatus Pacearchaeota archaeon]|nr:hypothetical protein [Candidatus Pacearchaeota archaeon]